MDNTTRVATVYFIGATADRAMSTDFYDSKHSAQSAIDSMNDFYDDSSDDVQMKIFEAQVVIDFSTFKESE